MDPQRPELGELTDLGRDGRQLIGWQVAQAEVLDSREPANLWQERRRVRCEEVEAPYAGEPVELGRERGQRAEIEDDAVLFVDEGLPDGPDDCPPGAV